MLVLFTMQVLIFRFKVVRIFLLYDYWQLISQKLSFRMIFKKTFNHQELIIGLYSIDLYTNFNFGHPLSTSISRFLKFTVKGCNLESTFFEFWIFSNLYKSANFCRKLKKKVSKCSYVQVEIELIKRIWKIFFH